jgi:uncharacterized protein
MPASVVRGVKHYLALRMPELDALTISWFGGEPLLARELIEDFLVHVRRLLEANPRVHFFSDITTNGYLLSRAVFERLLELGVVQYQIAFDGPREWHDRYRRRADGRGVFDRIWGNLQAMKDVEGRFKVFVRLHFNKDNYDALAEFIDAYRQSFENDDRFSLFLRPLSRFGGVNDPTLPVFSAKEAARRAKALVKTANDCGVNHLADLKVSPICYASRGNSFVVRADGRLNKCAVALEHKLNQIGRIREDGFLEIHNAKLRPWLRGVQSRRPSELQCPLRGLETSKLRGDRARLPVSPRPGPTP